MPNKIMSRQEYFFLQNETTFGQIPNTTGTATVAGSNACSMIQFKMNRTVDSIVRKDKTGSRTATAGIPGRQSATFSTNMSLVTSGTAGTAPDCDPVLRSLFGAAPTAKSGTITITAATNASPIVITATAHGMADYDCVNITGVGGNTAANGLWSVRVVDANTINLVGSTGNAAYTSGGTGSKVAIAYSPADAQLSFTGWSFRNPSTSNQRAIGGCVSKQATFNLGEDIATWQCTGEGYWQNDSLNFSNATTAEKMGLTAFPTLPGSIVTNGTGIGGFTGAAVMNGVIQARIRTAQIKYGSGLDIPNDIFGSPFGDIPEADERNIVLSYNMYEDDSASQAALEQAAARKSSIDFVFQVGTVAGNAYFMVVRGVQLAVPERDDSSRAFTMAYGDSRAYGSGVAAFNEMKLWAI